MTAMDVAAQRSGRRALHLVAVVAMVGLIALALLGRIMGYDLRRDEFMFVPPAALLADHALYRDIFYNHVPYSAWLFRAVHLALPMLGLLAAARLAVFLAWLLLLGGAAWIGWRLTRSGLVAGFAALGLVTADVLLGQAGMAATNNMLPLPFALLGLGLLAISLAERQLSFPRLLLAGLLLSIAAGMKASAIAFIPAVAIGCFLYPRDRPFAERARRVALPVALGGLLGALPLLWLALTEPGLFFAHIASYHTGPHVAYWQANAASEPGLAMGGADKLQLAWTVWMAGPPLLSLFVLLLAAALRPAATARGDATGAVAIVLAATLCAALMAFLPTPGFPQYYAAPLVGLPLLTALLWRRLPDGGRAVLVPTIGVAMALMLVIAAPRLLVGLVDLRNPQGMTVFKLDRGAAALRQRLEAAGLAGAGPVATLSPLYPVQAGLPIYPEFAAGPFAYRVAPYTSPELRARYVMAGPDDLAALFAARPPAAIVTGFDAALEAPLVAYAQAQGWQPEALDALRDRYGTAVLWLPPAAPTQPTETGGSR